MSAYYLCSMVRLEETVLCNVITVKKQLSVLLKRANVSVKMGSMARFVAVLVEVDFGETPARINVSVRMRDLVIV